MPKDEFDPASLPLTEPVPVAGRKYYGAGRDKSYQMARDGTMPAIKVGKNWRALPHKIVRQLKGS
jgi:hypothetical protein